MSVERLECTAGGSTARTPHRRHESSMQQQKSPLEKEDSDEREGARTLNQRLKRPMLCH